MNITSILNRLDRTLVKLGFKRRNATWNRERGHFTDVLDVQVSKAASTVTINVGVMERGVYAQCWGREAEPFVEEPFCTVRARIGELIDGRDKWWDIHDDAKCAEEMVSCAKEYALPFLERMHSLQEMANWLVTTGAPSPKSPLPAISLAVIRHALGDHAEACSILSGLGANVRGAWRARVKEVSERIGCDGLEL